MLAEAQFANGAAVTFQQVSAQAAFQSVIASTTL
jgi:hypothetical protein